MKKLFLTLILGLSIFTVTGCGDDDDRPDDDEEIEEIEEEDEIGDDEIDDE